MMRYWIVWPLLIAEGVCAGGDLAFVRGGESAYSICFDTRAPSSVKLAAKELQTYVRKAAGATLPIVNRPRSPMICLGDCAAARAAGFTTDGLPMEGYRIATRGRDIFILGPDTANGGQTPQGGFSRGTLFGAYTFLEKFVGVRWLMPGQAGEFVPHSKALTMHEGSFSEGPSFMRRRLPYVQDRRAEVKQWKLRNKLGESLQLHHSHNWRRAIPAPLYDKHPDFFAMRGGKRALPVGRYKLCTTNPGLIRAYTDAAIAALERNSQLHSYSLSPSDSGNWCECKQCTALDETDPNGNRSLTPRILTFYNAVARLVAKRFPDRLLCGYVYSCYVFPPRKPMRLEPNVFLVWAPGFDYGFTQFRPDLREQWDNTLAGWTALTHNVAYYDLCAILWPQGAGAPNPPGIKILKHTFPLLKRSGMKGVYLYGVSAWGHGALHNYLLAKLSWDADADVDALFDDFCDHAYGRGAEEMKQVYRLLDAAMEKHYRADKNARYTLTPAILKGVYAPLFPRIEALHQAALAKAKAPRVRKRLEMFGDNMKVLCWNLDANGMLHDAKKSAYSLSSDAFAAFINQRANSLALAQARRRMKCTSVRPVTVRLLKAPPAIAEPMRPYRLRRDQDILLYAAKDGPVAITFTDIIQRSQIIRCELTDAKGKRLLLRVVRANDRIVFDAAAGRHYWLRMNACDGSWAIKTSAAFAIDATSSRRGVHFQGKVTPLYFYVPKGTRRFTLTLVSDDAPLEHARAKLYDPTGKLVAKFRAVDVPSDRQSVEMAEHAAGVWKLAVEKADKGCLDDVWVTPGASGPGFFSLDSNAVLVVHELKPRR